MTRGLRFYVAVALMTLVALWFYRNFEYTSEREHVGFRGEAARNPLLALERLLARLSYSVQHTRDPAALGQEYASATLFLPRGRAAYTRARANRVAEWVSQGGHLIVEAERLRDRDSILDALGIERRDLGPPGAATEPARRAAEVTRATPAEIRLPGSQPLRVTLPPGMRLVPAHPDRVRLASQDTHGTTLLHLEVGRGRVTVLPSLTFLMNDMIGQLDHAPLALALVRLMAESRTVVVAPRFEQPSLTAWLAREASVAIAASAILLALWLWRSAVRFGPLEPRPERARRRLLDHLRASGRFLWRSGASASLLAAARESALQRIARARPVLADLTAHERTRRLAELTQIPAREIEHAWSGVAETPAAFTAAVHTLQRIEEKLTRRPGA